MLSVLDSSVILIFIPIFDKLVYPFMAACGVQPTLLRKIGAGLVFSLLSMIVAGWLERERKRSTLISGIPSNCGTAGEVFTDVQHQRVVANPTVSAHRNQRNPDEHLMYVTDAANLLVMMLNTDIVFCPAYDLFYSEVPESMRSVCQALNLLTTTLGYIVAGGLNSVFSFWITSDLNDGKLEYIFYVMAILVLINIVAFIYVSQSFEYHVPPPRDKAFDRLWFLPSTASRRAILCSVSQLRVAWSCE
ncbi:hypothetical protein PINS_up019784 [Pythium insidiosum]|nr:hypothetical protein PINS_up019784 [Pythium insidiosum]